MARLALAVTGAVVGSYFGQPGLGFAAGSMLGNLIFGDDAQAPNAPDREGPRLGDLSVSSSAYGRPVTITYGTMRMAGNIIWSLPLREEARTESGATPEGQSKGKGGGGKGAAPPAGSFTTYAYFATFAIAFSEGPIEAFRRIWFDGKLVYDARASAKVVSKGIRFRAYFGREDQEPDSLIVADKGAGSVPAHRGLAYLVFDDVPLADFGNRTPQVTAEIVASASSALSNTIVDVGPLHNDNMQKAPGLPYLVGTFSGNYWAADTVNIRKITNRQITGDTQGLISVDEQGRLYGQSGSNYVRVTQFDALTLEPIASVGVPSSLSTDGLSGGGEMLPSFLGPYFIRTLVALPNPSIVGNHVHLIARAAIPEIGVSNMQRLDIFTPTRRCKSVTHDLEGNAWILCQQSGVNALVRVALAPGNGGYFGTASPLEADWEEFDLPTGSVNGATKIAYAPDDHSLLIGQPSGGPDGTTIAKFDIASRAIIDTTDIEIDGLYHFAEWRTGVQNGRLYLGGRPPGETGAVGDWILEIEAGSLELLRSWSIPDQGFPSARKRGMVFDENAQAAWVVMNGFGLTYFPLGRIDANGVALSAIVGDLCARAGLQPAEYDTTPLIEIVTGYALGRQSSVRGGLEPLTRAFLFDAVESDHVVKFINRGGAPADSITNDDLGASDQLQSAEPRLIETRTQEIELPERVDVIHLDPDLDHQQGTQHAKRLQTVVGSRERLTVEAPLALTADQAKRAAERILYLTWVERNAFELKLPPRYARLDATDVVTVTRDNIQFRLRLTQVDVGAGGIIACRALAEDEVVYVSAATGATAAGVPGQALSLPGPTVLFLMDVPLLRDLDSTGAIASGVYFATAATTEDWRGAAVYRSDDGRNWDLFGASRSKIAWGAPHGVVPAPPGGLSTTWDETTVITVALIEGELESRTDLEVLNGANAALIGQEIVQYVNAVDNGDGTWTLSRLLRGRRGTEWAMDQHDAGDRFIALPPAGLQRKALPLEELNVRKEYVAISLGATLGGQPPQQFAPTGTDLKPYAPAHIAGTRDGADDLTITWVRRTRVGGAWRDGTGVVPLAEDTEAYEVDILDAPGGTVVRTFTSITSPSAIYTAADQVTDFGVAQSAVHVVIYQLSGVVGRGFPGKATV